MRPVTLALASAVCLGSLSIPAAAAPVVGTHASVPTRSVDQSVSDSRKVDEEHLVYVTSLAGRVYLAVSRFLGGDGLTALPLANYDAADFSAFDG